MTDTIKKHLLNAYLSLAIVSIFWGTTYYAIHVGVQYTSGFALAGLRQAIAGLLLAGYFVLRGHRLPDLKTLGKLFVIGVLMFVFSNGFVSIACQYVPSGLVAIIAATVPIWISLLGFFFLKEKKVSALLILGLLLGFVGIVGIFYDYVDDLLVPEFRLGILLAFIACLSWASGSIYFIRAHLKVNLLFGAGLQMLFAGIVMMGLSEFTSQPVTISHLPADYWWSLIYLITVGSVIGYSAYAYTLKKLPASLVSVYAYVNPIVAVILGWIFLHEKFDVITAISCTVTLLGVFIVNQSMRKAVSERIEGKIRIADYESPQDQVHFERLNRAWIEKYFRMEEIDVQVLTNPEEHILQDGGFILMAYYNDEVAGTVALRKVHGDFELTKMAVDEKYRGKGIGDELMKACIEKSRDAGIKKLILYSNRILAPAINLYRKTGFIEVPLSNGEEYERSDIKMELPLTEMVVEHDVDHNPVGGIQKPSKEKKRITLLTQ